jgi:hypothetical protein
LADQIINYKKTGYIFYAGKEKDRLGLGVTGSFLAWKNFEVFIHYYLRYGLFRAIDDTIFSSTILLLAAASTGLLWAVYQEKEKYCKQRDQDYENAVAVKQLLLKHKNPVSFFGSIIITISRLSIKRLSCFNVCSGM